MSDKLTESTRRVAGRVSIAPFRVIAYLLHATGLERIYKPRFTRYASLLDLTDEIVAELPKHCYTISGAQMDPMNVIFVGSEDDLKLLFKRAGWHRANPASPVHLIYGLFSSLARRPYRTGPFSPLYVNIGLQDLAYQQVTKEQSFKRRHHLRIWKTGKELPNGKEIWVGACSFDTNLKVQLRPPFIHHAIDPDLDQERAFLVRSLTGHGAARVMSVAMTPAVYASAPASNGYGARYFTDGRAEVVEV